MIASVAEHQSIINRFVSYQVAIQAKKNGDIGVYSIEGEYLEQRPSFDIYWREHHHQEYPELTDVIFIGEPSDVDDDVSDDEYDYALLPQAVKDKGWELYASGENFESVIENAVYQKSNVSDDEIRQAIEYYLCNDTFMDF